MQVSKFSDGGFVAHKINGGFSAWYDAAGNLLDCERIDSRGRSYPVQEEYCRKRLARVGLLFLKAQREINTFA